ncbi:response regulator [Roseomonas sp. E05]|uniref:response regulator n=1 Tax=Roseomonas sp. E05 TaxID=3046310 RepID=UPI0024BAABB7|nr:response regulator [Roseomonas sp. E05]MDJ0388500.1 response regulator [Roseomonas sp. E05]
MNKISPAGCGTVLQGKRILVAEDEVLISIMLEDALIEAGALVLGPAISVPDALRLLDAAMGDGGVSAALLDLKLGRGGAGCLADALAERGVPFIFATAYGACRETERHRAVPVLAKPYFPDDVLQALETVLSARA